MSASVVHQAFLSKANTGNGTNIHRCPYCHQQVFSKNFKSHLYGYRTKRPYCAEVRRLYPDGLSLEEYKSVLKTSNDKQATAKNALFSIAKSKKTIAKPQHHRNTHQTYRNLANLGEERSSHAMFNTSRDRRNRIPNLKLEETTDAADVIDFSLPKLYENCDQHQHHELLSSNVDQAFEYEQTLTPPPAHHSSPKIEFDKDFIALESADMLEDSGYCSVSQDEQQPLAEETNVPADGAVADEVKSEEIEVDDGSASKQLVPVDQAPRRSILSRFFNSVKSMASRVFFWSSQREFKVESEDV